MKNFIRIIFVFYVFSICTVGQTLQHAKYFDKNLKLNPKQYFVSEKLDGFRGYWDGENLKSKNGNTYNAPKWFIESLGDKPLDGELWIGRGEFEKTASILSTTINLDDWHLISYMIFDMPKEQGSFKERVAYMEGYIPTLNLSYVKIIPQKRVKNIEDLNDQLDKITKLGGEGLILHHEDAYYGSGRVDHLMKIKKYDEQSGIIIGYTPGKGKYIDKVGALILQLDDGSNIKVGSGLTDLMRENPPKIGHKILFRYNGLTKKGKPRFARFNKIVNNDFD